MTGWRAIRAQIWLNLSNNYTIGNSSSIINHNGLGIRSLFADLLQTLRYAQSSLKAINILRKIVVRSTMFASQQTKSHGLWP